MFSHLVECVRGMHHGCETLAAAIRVAKTRFEGFDST